MRRRPTHLTKEVQGDRIDTNTFVSQVNVLSTCLLLLPQRLIQIFVDECSIFD